jgi:hypothetical protein
MSKYSSKDVGFHLLGGYSLLGSDSKYDDTVELRLNETDVLGQADEVYWSSGAKKTDVVQEGWYDDAVGANHNAFNDLPVLALPMSIAPHGNVNAAAVDMYQSVQRVGWTVQVATSEVTKAQARYGIWYGKRRGNIVHALGSETTAGNTDTLDVQLPAAATNGGAFLVHVTSVVGGSGSVTIGLRDGGGTGVTYTPKVDTAAIAFASIPSASGIWVPFTGTLGPYVSVSWTYATLTGVTFAASVYVAP